MSAVSVLTKAAGAIKFWGIKNAPELLLAGGFAAGAAALYFTGKGTISAKEVIERHKEGMDEIQEAIEVADEGEFTERDVKINKIKVYGNTAWEMFKVYAPAIIFVTLSVACILASHGILKKRNVILATTLSGVRAAFEEYRGRVRDELGEEKDEHFLYATEDREIETEVVDEETGKTKKKKEKYKSPTKISQYARFYDETAKQWTKDGGANYNFVRAKMITLQDKLVAERHLFLNDVYKALGLPITIAGQSAGWIYDPNDRNNTLIAFKGFDGLGSGYNLSGNVRAFMNGAERNCLIDFVNIKDNILVDLPRVDTEIAPV